MELEESMGALSTPNHTIDPATGFLQSLGFDDAFDATKKLAFVQVLREKGFNFLATCRECGISPHTISKHRRIDQKFDDLIKDTIREYGESLEWVSRSQAMEPKATLERIFQLRSLFPQKYARELKENNQRIEINIAGDLMMTHKKETAAIETSIVREIDDNSHIPHQITVVSTENVSSTEECKDRS